MHKLDASPGQCAAIASPNPQADSAGYCTYTNLACILEVLHINRQDNLLERLVVSCKIGTDGGSWGYLIDRKECS